MAGGGCVLDRFRAALLRGEVKEKVAEDKIQTGLRIAEGQYARIKEIADRMGVSINQLILVLVDIGLNHLEKEQLE